MALVYCYTNKTNGKKYIGITIRDMEDREKSHLYEAYNKNSLTYDCPFKRAIRKYGINGFDLEILHDNIEKSEAIELEKYYIEHYQTYYKYLNSNGYNATIGGEYISQPKSRVYEIDVLNGFKITNIFNSVLEAERFVGKRITPYHQRTKPYASSTKYVYIYENDYCEETFEYDFLNRLKQPVVQLSLDGEFIKTWMSINEAKLGTGATNISLCLSGNRITTGGYRWITLSNYMENLYTLREPTDMKTRYVAIDFDGNLKGRFSGLDDARLKTGASPSTISNIFNGKTTSRLSGGYIWFLEAEYDSLSLQDLEHILKEHSIFDNRVIAFNGSDVMHFNNKVECGNYFNFSSNTIKIKIVNQERVDGWLLNNRNRFTFIHKEERIVRHDTPLSNNSVGYKNITYIKERNKYLVLKKHEDIVYRKYAKTLEEAILIRDKLYEELGLVS